ncbi:Cell division protein ZapD [hydrothermal vent metagenome]|uniref:Cell division protein ZapD n=1 Tax=hydrothermal vent metagenome TaxID=652676 RepID=A0A3B0YZM2_9ZZZZ
MKPIIIYEQPLNERIRTFLRLEFLFSQAAHHLRGKSHWDSRSTLTALLDIMAIFGRTDLKTEVLKELERNATTLTRLEKNPDVDSKRLGDTLAELDTLTDRLHHNGGPIAASLRSNEFLSAIQQRSAIAGGTCDFDLPGYHFWLEQPAAQRTRDLAEWLNHFENIAHAIQLILKLIRESASIKSVVAQGGFFQKTLDPNLPCQLVRVSVKRKVPYFAEISGGRHRFTVRFLSTSEEDGHVHQTTDDIAFELGCCAI